MWAVPAAPEARRGANECGGNPINDSWVRIGAGGDEGSACASWPRWVLMTELVSFIATVKGEPPARLERMARSIANQQGVRCQLVVASPEEDCPAIRALPASSALETIVWARNPSGQRSVGLNVALGAATGEVICRVDARSSLPADYAARCSKRLHEDVSVGVVGGHQVPVPEGPGVIAIGIARTLRGSIVLGRPAYRSPSASGEVDTVYLGAFRRVELEALGGFDSRFHANEDFELCQRYRSAGRRIWLESGLHVAYESRSGYRDVFRQYHEFGRWKVRFWRTTGRRPNGRQAVAVALATAGFAMAVSSRRRTVALGAAAAFAAQLGGGPAPLTVRAAGSVAGLDIVVAWLSGIAREVIFPNGPSHGPSPEAPV
jgi:succinoglycan biosynthesis protein ExoA